jgi:hypothetical protein
MAARASLPNDTEAQRLAYHEAGHAVVAWLHGFPELQIDMRGPCVGDTSV